MERTEIISPISLDIIECQNYPSFTIQMVISCPRPENIPSEKMARFNRITRFSSEAAQLRCNHTCQPYCEIPNDVSLHLAHAVEHLALCNLSLGGDREYARLEGSTKRRQPNSRANLIQIEISALLSSSPREINSKSIAARMRDEVTWAIDFANFLLS